MENNNLKITISGVKSFTDEELKNITTAHLHPVDHNIAITSKSPDNNVNEVCEEFVTRSTHGLNKYGTTTERNDLNFDQWLQHLKEELMDAVVYVHRVQKERASQSVTINGAKYDFTLGDDYESK